MILIIGSSSNYNYLNEVRLMRSFDQFKYNYDYVSSLASGCEQAFNLGQTSVYVCNVQADTDYFEIIDQIKSLEIDFIVPIDLRFDKKILLKDGRKIPICLILSEFLPDCHFIITDYHAKDFTSMSHFLKHYNLIRHKMAQASLYPENITLVANNLSDNECANVSIACAILGTPIANYPTLQLGDNYYALENEDFLSPVVYTKNGIVQNLFNMSTGLESNLIIQYMLKTLRKEMDGLLEYLIGTRFKKNTLFTVRYKVEDHLNFRKNSYYIKYRIIDIVIKNKAIEVIVDIYPFLSSDSIRTQVVIKGA